MLPVTQYVRGGGVASDISFEISHFAILTRGNDTLVRSLGFFYLQCGIWPNKSCLTQKQEVKQDNSVLNSLVKAKS